MMDTDDSQERKLQASGELIFLLSLNLTYLDTYIK